ncbi:DUF6868 family protein [Sulfuriroseicoccus oceanibius]|uniref:DUF6868 domain-containing protein n=1 Tax=Sulfuriroseicoccus oceanibius TaxID=2707525 RepID=A0A6B3L0T8_9BACT|nr:hypothetical protein [Sulfuriroseicoccus oceanibius]QQL44288.1 hypothetical protein G3M56_010345 [Sulfuriroseicoccus oceanibius]
MSLSQLSPLLGWCAIINLGLLLWWWIAFLIAKDTIYKIHTRWFALTRPQFEAIHYCGMGLLKLANLCLFITPWIALQIIR